MKYKKIQNMMLTHVGKRVSFAFLITAILTVLVFFADQYNGLVQDKDGKYYLERNTYGAGARQETLIVKGIGMGEGIVEFEIGELEYNQEEVRQILKDAAIEIETLIRGNNESLECVREDLNLISQIPEKGIEVNWELSDYTVIDITGKLNEKAVKEEGNLLELTAILTYRMESVRHTFPIHIFPPKMSDSEKQLKQLADDIQAEEIESRSMERVYLPEEFQGEKVTWSLPKENRWFVVLLLGVSTAGLLVLKEREDKKKAVEKRNKQMMLDYPGIINKLTIYTGAGMTIRKAWGRIVQEYEKNQRQADIRFAYEEMRVTWHELGDGVSERECYERFGNRCKLQPYLKLGALLSHNLRKGTKGLSDLLRIEAINAFEERKLLARKQGEEAGTKLLMPMFAMLAIVLVIVILPAFLSIQF